MVTINSAFALLLMIGGNYASASPSIRSDNAATVVNIATIIPKSFTSDHENSSALQHGSIDFMLVGNTSTSDMWLDVVPGYSGAAENSVLYHAAGWILLEDGAQYEQFSSFWARFRTGNPTATAPSHLAVCTMVVDWEDSLSEAEATLAAVEIEARLKENCGENDTIALAFTSSVTNTVANYLKGINGAEAPTPLQDADSTTFLKGSMGEHVFVRVAEDVCTRETFTVASPASSPSDTEILVVTLSSGESCAGASSSHDSGFVSPEVSREDNPSSNDSDWKNDLAFVVPVGICIFLLGCAGLAYVLREKKNTATDEAPKDEAKRIITSLPYVLTMHPVV